MLDIGSFVQYNGIPYRIAESYSSDGEAFYSLRPVRRFPVEIIKTIHTGCYTYTMKDIDGNVVENEVMESDITPLGYNSAVAQSPSDTEHFISFDSSGGYPVAS